MEANDRGIGGVTFDKDVDFASLDALRKKLKSLPQPSLTPMSWIEVNKIALLIKAIQWRKMDLLADLSGWLKSEDLVEAAILADDQPVFEKHLQDCSYLPELERLLQLAGEKGRTSMQDRLKTKIVVCSPAPQVPRAEDTEEFRSDGRTR